MHQEDVKIRHERPGDADAIRQLTTEAFAGKPYASGTEAAITDNLRSAGALTLSIVATLADKVVGHIALSPVLIDGEETQWFGIGPLSVQPSLHRQGIGSSLVHQGLSWLKANEARGCVVLGDPAYYMRFGFKRQLDLLYDGAPAEYFMALSLDGSTAVGKVAYHAAFSVE
jgi:putative acetyltransferase